MIGSLSLIKSQAFTALITKFKRIKNRRVNVTNRNEHESELGPLAEADVQDPRPHQHRPAVTQQASGPKPWTPSPSGHPEQLEPVLLQVCPCQE